MSYITINGLQSTPKMIMSFWFRVPQKSIDAQAAYVASFGGTDASAPLNGCLPLVVFGNKGTSGMGGTSERIIIDLNNTVSVVQNLSGDVMTYTAAIISVSNYHTVVTHTHNENISFIMQDSPQQDSYDKYVPANDQKPTEPSFIGVDCSDPENPRLYVNIESAKKATCTGMALDTTHSTHTITAPSPFAYTVGVYQTEGDTIPFGGPLAIDPATEVVNISTVHEIYGPDGTVEIPDITDTDISDQTETETGAIFSDNNIDVSADEWHNLIVAVNFTPVQTHGKSSNFEDYGPSKTAWVESSAQLFVALDDVNYRGFDLSSQWVYNSAFDYNDNGNAVITRLGDNVAGSQPPRTHDGIILPASTYLLSSPTINFGGAPFGVPATATYVPSIHECEMGSMQLFTGVFDDPAKLVVRRLFIKEPDDKGVQKPAKRKAAEKYFGREPDVKLFTFGSWTKPEIATGQIDKYKPTPNLGGDQGV